MISTPRASLVDRTRLLCEDGEELAMGGRAAHVAAWIGATIALGTFAIRGLWGHDLDFRVLVAGGVMFGVALVTRRKKA